MARLLKTLSHLLVLVLVLAACIPTPTVAIPATTTVDNPTQTPSIQPTQTPEPTNSPSPTSPPTLITTPTLAPIGTIQPIPQGFVYLGEPEQLALGFNMSAGGSIGSLLYNGLELVDRTDLGRYIQLSFYDGNDTYGDWNDPSDIYGWNPEQAGDQAGFGATVLEYRTADEGLYIKAIGKEWGQVDEDSDVIFETWAWQRAGYFEVHLRGSHVGTDTHTLIGQEFPAAYFATFLTHEFGYFGDAPFTSAPTEELNLVGGPVICPPIVPTENWAAFGTSGGLGLILAVPPQRYLSSDWHLCLLAHVTPAVGYITPIAYFDVPPGAIREETIYLIPGPIDSGRAIVYDLIPHTIWTFDLNSTEGWTSSSTPVSVVNGVLSAYFSPADWLTSRDGLQINGAITPTVSIRTRFIDTASTICLQFIIATDSSWNSSKSECVLVAPNNFHTYEFPMQGNTAWNGNAIPQLRLTASKPGWLEIDSLKINQHGYAWEFETDADSEGWLAWSQLETLQVNKGLLSTRSTGSDPYMGSPDALSIDAATLSLIELRMKVSAGTLGELFFITDSDEVYDGNKSLLFSVIADGQFHTYTLDMSVVSQWQGTIRQLRLDPTDTSAEIEIDYVRVRGR